MVAFSSLCRKLIAFQCCGNALLFVGLDSFGIGLRWLGLGVPTHPRVSRTPPSWSMVWKICVKNSLFAPTSSKGSIVTTWAAWARTCFKWIPHRHPIKNISSRNTNALLFSCSMFKIHIFNFASKLVFAVTRSPKRPWHSHPIETAITLRLPSNFG